MKYKKIKLSAIFLLSLWLSGLNAQTMYVNENSETQTAYLLSNIRKISFSSGSLIVTKTDDNNNDYFLNDLSYLNFVDLLNEIEKPKDIYVNNINIYPNPTNNWITVVLPEATEKNGRLSILSLTGKVLKTQKMTNVTNIQIDLSDLSQGIYLCKYSNGIEIKTIKIIKE